jgi:fermentation-respiration switch protein FrsA (DUF1100 family)
MAEVPLVFQARPYPQGDWEPRGLQYEDVHLRGDNGLLLHGWYFAEEHPRAQMLYCHGAGENVAIAAPVVAEISRRLRLSSLVFDYRGYGRSAGTPSEAGVLADASVAQAWVCERGRTNPDKVVLMGQSLGGAIAIDRAACTGAAAVVVVNTFTSLTELFERRAPYIEPGATLDALARLRHFTGPLFVCHASDDEWVPYDLGVKLFASHAGPKQFFRLEGASHDTPPTTPDLLDSLDRFLANAASLT